MILISSIEEYYYTKNRGFEPLLDLRFRVLFFVRKELQDSLFNGSVPKKNDKFYRWNWNNRLHRCEECNTYLSEYSAKFISHILPRSAYPEIAHDVRNCNILCLTHHSQWENKPEAMRIYSKNFKTIELLKQDYVIK